MTDEMWAAIPGFEGFYEASSFRRIRSLDRVIVDSRGQHRCLTGRMLWTYTVAGEESVVLSRNGTRFTVAVDVVVERTFAPVAA
jgi:hypothetical protein